MTNDLLTFLFQTADVGEVLAIEARLHRCFFPGLFAKHASEAHLLMLRGSRESLTLSGSDNLGRFRIFLFRILDLDDFYFLLGVGN
jgi:hypothetical protein